MPYVDTNSVTMNALGGPNTAGGTTAANDWILGGVVYSPTRIVKAWTGTETTGSETTNCLVCNYANHIEDEDTRSWPTYVTSATTFTIDIATTGTITTNLSAFFGTPKLEEESPRTNHLGRPVRSARRGTQFSDADAPEMVALALLRKMVPQDDFRRYLRHGFVVVRGPSGLTYQIDRDRSARIRVRDRGEEVARLCVHVGASWASIPPTDEVVAKMILVECDEPDIWKRSNVSWLVTNRDRPALHAVGQGTPFEATLRAQESGSLFLDVPACEMLGRVAR